MKLIALIFLYSLGQAGISSSEKPVLKTDREPAAVGDAIIQNKDNFRVEAFGESRAKAHKQTKKKKKNLQKNQRK